MTILDKCKQIIDTESGRVLLYRDEVEAVLTAGDTISRQAAIDTLENTKTAISENGERYIAKQNAIMRIDALPSAQPDIIRCRNCKFASGDSRICMKFDHSPIGELDFCSFAERREVNHESN